MNNKGWGLGIMLICIAAIGICLIAANVFMRRYEKITNVKLVHEPEITWQKTR